MKKPDFKLPFFEAFNIYALENGISENSFTSYLSYLKSLDTYFFQPLSDTSNPSPFIMLKGDYFLNTPLKKIIDSLYDWKSMLDSEISSPQLLQNPQSTIRKWMSAYTLYVDFIENYFGLEDTIEEPNDSIVEEEEKVSPQPVEKEKIQNIRASKRISEKVLLDSCTRKLRTQDRVSVQRKTNLPIYYISKILNSSNEHKANDKFIDSWVKALSKKITALIEKDGSIIPVPITDIEFIRIYGNRQPATIQLHGAKVEYPFITRTCKNEFRPMFIARENEIHIDHEPSLDIVLTNNSTSFPALTKVSDIIRKIAKANGLKGNEIHNSHLAKKIMENPEAQSEILNLLPEIENELNVLDSMFSRLELMHKSENIAKGNGSTSVSNID